MKKILYFLASIVLFIGVVIACTNPSIEAEDELLAKPDGKVTICHFDADVDESYQITISTNGLNGHDGHEFDDIPPLGELLEDSDNDGIVDCADCNTEGKEGSEKTFKYFRDSDLDGFGDPNEFILKCKYGEPYYMKDGFKYILDGTDCDDGNETLFPFSPTGEYFILRENSAVLNITITSTSVDGEITETNVEGYGRNMYGEAKYYHGATFEFLDENKFLMTVPQYSEPDGNGTGPGTHYIEGSISECDGIFDLEDKNQNSDYNVVQDCENDKNWLKFSPAMTDVTIYRENGAFLTLTIEYDGNMVTSITGQGRNALNELMYYNNATFTFTGVDGNYEKLTFEMTVPQFLVSDNIAKGTHYINGFVSLCDGIVEDLSDKNNGSDYSLTPFVGVDYLPIP